MVENDRRRFQRIKLARPILGALDRDSALILDIGLGGAYIEHHGRKKTGQPVTLAFRWQGEELSFPAEVIHSRVVRVAEDGKQDIAQSGITFVKPAGASLEKLQAMMATFVGRILAAQRANANADLDQGGEILYQLGDARRSRSRGYLAYLWDGRSWTCRHTLVSDQPRSGFTVAAYEDEDELETLCRAYEAADEEGRRLIRLVAELSANSKRD